MLKVKLFSSSLYKVTQINPTFISCSIKVMYTLIHQLACYIKHLEQVILQ